MKQIWELCLSHIVNYLQFYFKPFVLSTSLYYWLISQTVLILISHTEYLSPCVIYFFCLFFTHWLWSESTTYYYLFTHVYTAELGLNAEVTELANECEQPGLVQSLLLPEDLALRHLPALSIAHRRLDFTRRNPSLSPLQEVGTLDFKFIDVQCSLGFLKAY